MMNPLKEMIVTSSFQDHINDGGDRAKWAGVDLKAFVPTPYYAIQDGKVSNYVDSTGAFVSQLNFADGSGYAEYVHGSAFIHEQGFVKEGTLIGLTGDSGNVTGPHLHFAIIINGQRIDPIKYLSIINEDMASISDTFIPETELKVQESHRYIAGWVDSTTSDKGTRYTWLSITNVSPDTEANIVVKRTATGEVLYSGTIAPSQTYNFEKKGLQETIEIESDTKVTVFKRALWEF